MEKKKIKLIPRAQNGKTLKEVTVSAPKKYFVGYDNNANPIYTTDYKQSQEYLQSQLPTSDTQQKRRQWSFERKGANGQTRSGLYGDAADLAKAAELGIGTTLAPLAAAPLVEVSMPVIEATARPLTTTTRVASKLVPRMSRALPYTEMADRGIMGYLGARGMYDASKGLRNGTMKWYRAVPEIGLSGLMMADAAPVVIKGMNKASTFMASPYTGKWTTIGNRQFRLSPNSLGINEVPVETRKLGDYTAPIDISRIRTAFEDYEKTLTQYKGYKLPDSPELKYEVPEIQIDLNNIFKDDFVDYLSKQTGKSLKRVPIKDTKHGNIYNEGFAFVDNEGKEIAYIAGRKNGKNVWVESSYVDPEFRHHGLGKQMYFDFNDNVFNTYGTTLHSSPYQRVGSIPREGMSPSNRLWLGLRKNNLSTIEGEGLNRYDVMAEPSQITTAYRPIETTTITPENAASITPEQWTTAQDAAIARSDMAEAQRLRDLHADVNGYNSLLSLYHGSGKYFNEFKAVPNFVGYTDYLSHFSINPSTASKFGDIRRFYTNVKKPLRVSDQGAIWHPSNIANELGIQPKYVKDPLEPYYREFQNIEGRGMYKEANLKFMKDELKGDAYIYDNEIEGGGDSYAIPVSRQVKLADAVTYDDNGVRIPLGKRDNFKLNDIRWGLLPFAGIIGTQKLNNK